MEVAINDNLKIYNLTKGDSIPDWVSSKRRRKLEKQHVGFRKSIRLIQDFDFPDVSSAISLTPDGRYILAAGLYKPSMKVFDVTELTVKFEHGLDADAFKILPISEDYSKLILLEDDRYVEIFANGYRHYRFRLPKFNRDMVYSKESSDLMVVGSGSQIYRFNLELGNFLMPFDSDAAALNCCALNDHHQLLLCGTADGRVEAFDHRDNVKVGTLDCALSTLVEYNFEGYLGGTQQISSIAYKDALTFGVGTSTGHVLLYDLRSSRPMLIKDHQMGLPIKKIDFLKDSETVLSMDTRIMKFWEEDTGKPLGSIEPGVPLDDFVRYPNSGLLFFTAECPQMFQYFVPSFGPAPKWCYHLDSIVEDLEEVDNPEIYDDYKFVTKEGLEEVGLDHLIGTDLLRAHMHGYFIDLRLYNRAKTLTQPQAVQNLRKTRLREEIEKQSTTIATPKDSNAPRVKVNKEFAAGLQSSIAATGDKKQRERAKVASKILTDDRFVSMFESSDFKIDENSEQFKQLIKNAVGRTKKTKKEDADSTDEDLEEGPRSGLFMEDVPTPDDESSVDDEKSESDDDLDSEESDDDEDDNEASDEEEKASASDEEFSDEVKPTLRKPSSFRFVSLGSRRELNSLKSCALQVDEGANETFGTRLKKLKANDANLGINDDTPFGTKSITITLNDEKKGEKEKQEKEHLEARRNSRRSAGAVMRHLKPYNARGRRRGGK